MQQLLFAVWECWTGQRARNLVTGEIYIGTSSEDWAYRLRVWKQAMREHSHNVRECPCPSPIPEGHVMLSGIRGHYEVLT